MKNKNNVFILTIQIILVLISFYLLRSTYPRIHPLSQTDFKITKSEAIDKAENFLDGEIPINQLEIEVSFVIEKSYFEEQKVIAQIRRLTGVQPFRYWDIAITSNKDKKLHISLNNQNIESVDDISSAAYKARISPEGRILLLDFEKRRRILYKDSLQGKKTPSDTTAFSGPIAVEKALDFMKRLGDDTTGLTVTQAELKQDSLGRIFDLVFKKNIQNLTARYEIRLTPLGKFLYYQFEPEVTLSKIVKESPETARIIFSIMEGLLYLLLFIFLIIYLIKFSRQDAISFKIALPFVYLISVIAILTTVSKIWNVPPLMIILMAVFFALLSGAGILLLYAVSDSLVRKEWDGKLLLLDRFRQRSFFTPETGKAVFRGVSLGIFSATIYSLILYGQQYFLNGLIYSSDRLEYSFSLIFPILAFGLGLVSKSIFYEFFFRLFGITLLKRFLKTSCKIILAGIIFIPVFSVEIFPNNVYIKLFAYLFPTLLFIFYFLRYDIFTTIVGFFTFHLLGQAIIFLHTNEPFFKDMGVGFYFIILVLLSYALLTIMIRRSRKEELPRIVPAYIEKQKERERLMREIEIARTIQQQFLPTDTPRFKNYDLAAFCRPAWEVGGDYYDYFNISPQRLGISIGDVSNKGISAAFFMTMVKGFLKALAIHHQNPAEILSETNSLFYDNVERGHFISMIFGILDTESGEFTFARAGHNPILLLFGQASGGKWLTPRGIAIGLAGDKKFRSTIMEEKIQMKAGDILILYTDGYPEAMNEKNEEFGEEKLQNFLNEKSQMNSREIIEALEKQITAWEGNQTALDDRTIIIVKRLK
jgi:sigma-B regulation protein RsbU (phosphoserine phosphatase)